MIPIFKPYMPSDITNELEKILYSGNLSYGKNGREFEKFIGDYIGNDKVVVTSTYNHALLMVLSVLDLKPGDEVIASPVSCLASNQPFAVKGLKVVWSDVDPATGAMDPEDVRRKISPKTRAIFHNHYCGYLGYVNEINDIGKQYGVRVIDDCIEAFGSELNGKRTGNIGTDITVFSFQTVRLPNTIDGGAIVFREEELYRKAQLVRDYGIDRSNFRNVDNEINKSCDIAVEGYGALMSEFNSYLGIRQMEAIENLIGRQKKNAERWVEIVSSLDKIKPLQSTHGATPNYWVFGTLCKDKNASMEFLRKNGYYATGVHINNNIYSVFKNNAELKGVNEFMDNFLALPSGWWLDSDFKI